MKNEARMMVNEVINDILGAVIIFVVCFVGYLFFINLSAPIVSSGVVSSVNFNVQGAGHKVSCVVFGLTQYCGLDDENLVSVDSVGKFCTIKILDTFHPTFISEFNCGVDVK